MERDKLDHILIGKDRRIKLMDVDDRRGNAVDLDILIVEILPLIDLLKVSGSMEGAGVAAFDFTAGSVHAACLNLDREALRAACDNVLNRIDRIAPAVVFSKKLDTYADARVMMELIKHIRECIESYDAQWEAECSVASTTAASEYTGKNWRAGQTQNPYVILATVQFVFLIILLHPWLLLIYLMFDVVFLILYCFHKKPVIMTTATKLSFVLSPIYLPCIGYVCSIYIPVLVDFMHDHWPR